jgi:hypothetical protein
MSLASVPVAHVHLPSDAFSVNDSAKCNGDIAQALRRDQVLSSNEATYNLLRSAHYQVGLVNLRLTVTVCHLLKSLRKRQIDNEGQASELPTNESRYNSVTYGPPLVTTSDVGKLLAHPVEELIDTQRLSRELKLLNSNQNHGMVRSDERLADAVFLFRWYRNGFASIISTIGFWKRSTEWLVNTTAQYVARGKTYIGQDNAEILDKWPTLFWIGSNGSGSVLASEQGCPNFATIHLDHAAPDGYSAGCVRCSPENKSLDYLYYQRSGFNVYIDLDPEEPIV